MYDALGFSWKEQTEQLQSKKSFLGLSAEDSLYNVQYGLCIDRILYT